MHVCRVRLSTVYSYAYVHVKLIVVLCHFTRCLETECTHYYYYYVCVYMYMVSTVFMPFVLKILRIQLWLNNRPSIDYSGLVSFRRSEDGS